MSNRYALCIHNHFGRQFGMGNKYKLCVRALPGWYVWAYKPVRTKKGKWVWRVSHVVAGPFSSVVEARKKYPDARRYNRIHNVVLDDKEIIYALGFSEVEDKEHDHARNPQPR